MASPDRDSEASSVDLLARSVNDATSSPVRPENRIFPPTPVRSTRRRGESLQLQDFYVNTPPPAGVARWRASPTRSIAQTEDLISPWRIRVRVEAERDMSPSKRSSSRRSSRSPAKSQPPRTITTTIPLKGLDSSPAEKRGRGRPRKSDSSTIRRKGTPKPTRTTHLPNTATLASEDGFVGITQQRTPRRGPGRPRNSRAISAGKEGNAYKRNNSTSPTKSSRGYIDNLISNAGGRKFVVEPANDIIGHVSEDDFDDRVEGDGLMHNDEEEDFAATRGPHILDSPDKKENLENQIREPLQLRSSVSPRKSSSNAIAQVQHDQVEHDPTEDHVEFDSIIESEGFSMVSLGSLPSAGQLKLQTGADSERLLASPQRLFQFSTKASHVTASTEKELIPVEPTQNKGGVKQITPLKLIVSSENPPAPPVAVVTHSPRALHKPANGTPKLVRVVRAGIALQGVLDEPAAGGTSQSDQPGLSASALEKSPRARLDDLFDGFGPGTRRELRAGLRLGEELARRQRLAKDAARSSSQDEDDVFSDGDPDSRAKGSPNQQTYTLKVPQPLSMPGRPSTVNQQLPSPDDSGEVVDDDKMSWRLDTPQVNTATTRDQAPASQPRFNVLKKPIIQAKTLAQREADWEKERRAVSKQVEAANASQVIVINGDESGLNEPQEVDEATGDTSSEVPQEEATVDIWQEEAKSSSHLSFMKNGPSEKTSPDLLSKPRRSKLPTPWRRQSERRLTYSDEVGPEEQDMLKRKARQHQTDSSPETRKRTRHTTPAEMAETPASDKSQTEGSSTRSSPIPASVEQRVRQQLLGGVLINEPWRHTSNSNNQQTSSSIIAPRSKPESITQLDKMGTACNRNAVTKPQPGFSVPAGFTSDIASAVDVVSEPESPRISEPGLRHHRTSQEEARTLQTQLLSGDESALSQLPTFGPLAGIHTYDYLVTCVQSIASLPSTVAQLLGPPSIPKLSRLAFRPPASSPTPAQIAPEKAVLRPSKLAKDCSTRQPVLEPFSLYLPWTTTHYIRLNSLYVDALNAPLTYPFSTTSPYSHLLGRDVFSRGWRKALTELDLAVTDAFLELLQREGVNDQPRLSLFKSSQRVPIDGIEVIKHLFSLWAGRVQRGQLSLYNDVAGEWHPRLRHLREGQIRQQRMWQERQRQQSTAKRKARSSKQGKRRLQKPVRATDHHAPSSPTVLPHSTPSTPAAAATSPPHRRIQQLRSNLL